MEYFHGSFCKIRSDWVPDVNGTAIHLRHTNGMEVLHLKCDDKENLFAFAFRTPVMDDKGLPHIMEHSVLCGSQRYPLKEPFVNLMGQSVNTFLNAMTYPDMTVYPAASVNAKDYYNLMKVYGDAVFFPLLTENAFLQEAHRLELSDDGAASIQGVVYNEMKGAYSSFASVASDAQTAAMMDGTCYAHDSGGDPLEVARLTYQEFKDFHKKYYTQDNCLLFLYGNESTEKQLDFVQHEFLDRMELVTVDSDSDRRNPSPVTASVSEPPHRCEDEGRGNPAMATTMHSTPLQHQITVHRDGPDSDTSGAAVTLNWRAAHWPRTVDDVVSSSFLLQLLAGNDASPVTKALNESDLGDRLMCGISSSTADYLLYLGLGGVASGDEEQVKQLVMDTLNEVHKRGFGDDEIDAAILALDFSLREKVRTSDGPFSLVLMESAVSAWVYGTDPISYIERIRAFDDFKKRMQQAASPSEFCLNLLDKMMLCNNDSAFVTVSPTASFIADREAKEASLTQELMQGVDRGALKKRLKSLHDAQERKETAEEVSVVPSVTREDLSASLDPITTELHFMDGIPIIASKPQTNGIVYFKMLFPVDTLPVEDLPYLGMLGSAAFLTGADGQKWDDVLKRLTLCTGGISVTPMASTLYSSESTRAYLESVKQYHFTGREWMCFSMKFPIELIDRALPLFTLLLQRMDFDDSDRLKTLIAQEYDDLRSSIIPNGSRMAAIRTKCRMTRESAFDEVWNGISQLFALRRMNCAPAQETGERLKRIMQRITSSGTLVHITADDKAMQKTMEVLQKNGMLRAFKPLTAKPNIVGDEDIYGLTLLPGEKASNLTTYTLKSQVGFASLCFMGSKLDYERDAAATALCRWMGSGPLWEKIRTKGGAYGASGYVRARSGIATFATYRDPKPYASLDAIKECIGIACSTPFSDDDVLHLVTGSYSDYVEPLSPFRYGAQGLMNALYGMTNEDRNLALGALLALTGEKLHNVALLLRQNMESGYAASVMTQSPQGGETIDLGL